MLRVLLPLQLHVRHCHPSDLGATGENHAVLPALYHELLAHETLDGQLTFGLPKHNVALEGCLQVVVIVARQRHKVDTVHQRDEVDKGGLDPLRKLELLLVVNQVDGLLSGESKQVDVAKDSKCAGFWLLTLLHFSS